jgi:hypothetical protein
MSIATIIGREAAASGVCRRRRIPAAEIRSGGCRPYGNEARA